MRSSDPIEPTREWRNRVEQWMCRVVLASPEPDEVVQAWLDEATDGDEIAIQWALRLYRELRNLSAIEIEIRLASLRHDLLGNDR